MAKLSGQHSNIPPGTGFRCVSYDRLNLAEASRSIPSAEAVDVLRPQAQVKINIGYIAVTPVAYRSLSSGNTRDGNQVLYRILRPVLRFFDWELAFICFPDLFL